MESLILKKINRYSLINQIIPIIYFMIIYFFVETKWIISVIGFCSYTIGSIGLIIIYFLLGECVIKLFDGIYKKWPFVIPWIVGGLAMMLGLSAFIVAKRNYRDLSLVLIYGYIGLFAIDILLYLFPGCLIGSYTSKFINEKISNFYTLFSKNPAYFDTNSITKILEDPSKLDLFLRQVDNGEKNGTNIIYNLKTLKNKSIDEFIDLKTEILFRSNINLVSKASLFITVVNLFIFRYYSRILSVFTRLLLGKTVNLWKGLACGFGLGFICLTVVAVFFAFKKETEKRKFQKMKEYIKYADKN